MNETITRKDFLKHWFSYFRQVAAEETTPAQNGRFALPPGAQGLPHFRETCSRCYDCVSVCPHEALRVCHDGSELEGYPVLEPNVAPCYRCADYPCISACKEEALKMELAARPFGKTVPQKSQCLAARGMFCRSCQTACPFGEKVVQFGAEGPPQIKENCDGCGICVNACPAGAIQVIVQNL